MLTWLTGGLLGGPGCAPSPSPPPAFSPAPVVAIREAPTAAPAEMTEVEGAADPQAEPDPRIDDRGNVWGDSIGELQVAGGLGLSGVGPGGGGRGESIGLGSLGSLGHGEAAIPKVRTGAAAVAGVLPKEVIRRIIRQHLGNIRHCYEVALQGARPDLAGKLVIRFTIGGSGDVVSQQVAAPFDPSVDGCVAQVIAGMKFPQPEGGGVVVVSYPFVFRPDDGSAVADPDAGSPTP